MSTFLRNSNSKLCNAVSAPVAATRDALVEKLRSVCETAFLLDNWMDNIEYGREKLKDILEKEAEVKEKQQEGNDEQYKTVPKTKLVYEGTGVKEFRLTGH